MLDIVYVPNWGHRLYPAYEQMVQMTQSLSVGPRPRNASLTREAILKAAQVLFARGGYAAASTREISALAGSDPVLIRRYFGSKEGLFREALDRSFDMGAVLSGDRKRIGERVSRLFARPEGLPFSLSMIIFSASDLGARSIGQELLRKRVINALQMWVGKEESSDIALRLLTLWTGFFVTWEIVPLNEETQNKVGDLASWVGSQTQIIIDQYDDRAAAEKKRNGDRAR
jgi:AcrR family transcriptional regulator